MKEWVKRENAIEKMGQGLCALHWFCTLGFFKWVTGVPPNTFQNETLVEITERNPKTEFIRKSYFLG